MGLQFVLGGSGSGKSRRVYDMVISQALANPQKSYIILVPDQYTMQVQKQVVLLHPGHSILNIDVLSFSRLYHKVMEKVDGDTLTPLDDTGKNLMLRKLAEGMKDELPVLGRFMHRQGYITEIKSIISEMQQYGISPEGMQELIDCSTGRRGLQSRLEDIQRLYAAYVDYQQESYRTGESMYPILTRRLQDSALFRDAVVVLDGFTGFTPVQLPLVQELMILAKEMYITMTIGEEPSEVTQEQQLFYTTAKSIRELEKLAQQARVPVRTYMWCTEARRFEGSKELMHLERNLFRRVSEPYKEVPQNIVLFQAATPEAESTKTACEIKRLIRSGRYQYRDIAVICGSMDTYRYHLQESFLRMDIPFFMDTPSRILHNPAMELLHGLLEIIETDFSFSAVMRYLRSGFSRLTEAEIDVLELYLVESGVRGRKAFQRPFTRKNKDFSLHKINANREKLIEELAPCMFTGEEKVKDYAEAVYTFMKQLAVEERLWEYAESFEKQGDMTKAKEYRQIYRKLMELFNQMAALMGEEVLSFESFAEILRAGFEELQVGLIPANVDQVLVGDMERTRMAEIKVLFFVGMNDTNVPGNNTKGGMISDMDREFLQNRGVELAPTKRQLQFRQHFYLYQQLTKPAERLYLSYALTDNTEKEIRPSYFVGTLQKMFPGLEIVRYSQEEEPEHVSELFRQCAALLRKYAEGSLTQEQTKQLYIALRTLQEYDSVSETDRLVEEAFLTGGSEMLDAETAEALYGSVLYGSISRLEQYAVCPYGHFLKYGLGLKETEEFVLESADLGNIFHDVLADFGKGLAQDGYTWADFPKEYGERRITERLQTIKEQYGDELLLDKARNGYALSRADRILKRSVQVLQKHMQAGSFTTYGMELDFDVSCEWNAGRALMMRLQGRIDRLDVASDGDDLYVKVIDYKSGNKQLELDCMYEGLQLQLAVYLDSAVRMLKERMPDKQIHPAAMFYYRVADPVVSVDGAENFDALEDALLKEQRSRGILNSAPKVVQLLDATMESSSRIMPYGVKKDGTPAKGSGVCSEEQFKIMQDFMHKKLYEMGSEIAGGHIEKRPYVRKTQEEGCTYCPYKGVCGFDEKQYGYRKRQVAVMDAEEALQKMQEKCQHIGE